MRVREEVFLEGEGRLEKYGVFPKNYVRLYTKNSVYKSQLSHFQQNFF